MALATKHTETASRTGNMLTECPELQRVPLNLSGSNSPPLGAHTFAVVFGFDTPRLAAGLFITDSSALRPLYLDCKITSMSYCHQVNLLLVTWSCSLEAWTRIFTSYAVAARSKNSNRRLIQKILAERLIYLTC